MNKKLVKVLTLILSCLLLIGAAVGITVAAEEAEDTVSVKIDKRNIYYDSKVQIMYRVDSANVGENTVKMLFSDKEIAVSAGVDVDELAGVKVANVAGESNGKAVFLSDGILPTNYRVAVYAVAVVVDAEGKVVAYDAADAFSPYDYGMVRFDGTKTDAQFNLYKAMLDYGAAVQDALGIDVNTVGGWIDAYYKVTVDGETTTLRPSDLEDGKIALTESVARFNEAGEAFVGWVDAEGNTVVGWVDGYKAVAGSVSAAYAPAHESLQTFDTAASLDDVVGLNYVAKSGSFANIENGAIAFGKTEGRTIGTALKFAPATPGAYAREYVFETDFCIESWNLTLKGWIIKFDLWAVGDGNNGEILNVTMGSADSGALFTFGGITDELGTWHHVKLVASIADDGTVNLSASVDGAVSALGAQYAVKTNGDYKMIYGGLQFRDGGNETTENDCTQARVLLDNVACYTVGAAASYDVTFDANGGEAVAPYKVTMGEAYELPVAVNGELPFLGWYIGDTKVEQTGTWIYCGASEVDGAIVYGKAPTLTAKWATPVNVTLDAKGGVLESTTASVFYGQPYTLPIPTMGDYIFGGWVDADGNTVAAKGEAWPIQDDAALTAVWYVTVANNTYDFEAGSSLEGFNGTSAGSVSDGKFVINNTTWNPYFYFAMSPDKAVYVGNAAGSKYYFEMDFTYVGGGVASSSGKEPAYIGFQNATNFDKHNGSQYSNNELIKPTTTASAEGDAAGMIMHGVTFEKGVTYKVRFEHIVGRDAYVNVYVNDVFVREHNYFSTQASVDPTQVVGFQFTFRQPGNFIFDNVSCGIVAPVHESSFTLDAGVGTLAAEDDKTYTYSTNERYTLPTPTLEGYTFVGWYNGNTLIPQSGIWTANLGSEGVLKAKWAVTTTHGYTGAQPAAGSTGGLNFAYTTNNAVSAPGTVYTFSTNYTYKGLSSFNLADGVVSAQNANTSGYGYFRFYGSNGSAITGAFGGDDYVKTSGSWVDANGNTVVDASGKLLEEYAGLAATDIFFENIRFIGGTFKINTTYHISITFINNGDGTVSATGVATDTQGNSQTLSLSKWNDVSTITRFYYEARGMSSAGVTSYTLTHTFADLKFDIAVPASESKVTLNANGGTLPEGANGVDVMSGVAYELPVPTHETYEFGGWYNGSTKVANSGTWSITDEAVTLTAMWLETSESKTYANLDFKKSAWSGDNNVVYSGASVAAPGTVYVYTTDFTYKGISDFTVVDGAVTVNKTNAQYGYWKMYGAGGEQAQKTAIGTKVDVTSDIVNSEGVVVVENGALKAGYENLAATDLFFSKMKVDSLVFNYGETYKVEWTVTITGSGATVTIKATDSKGNEQSCSGGSYAGMTGLANFTFESRGADNADTDKPNAGYTIAESFTNNTIVVKTPVAEEAAE